MNEAHYTAVVLGENPYMADVHRSGYSYGGSWVTAAAKADHIRAVEGVGESRMLGFHSVPRTEVVATPNGGLELDLINPGVPEGAILPDGDEYYQGSVQEVAIEGIVKYLEESGRGPGDILHAHHWTSGLAIGPAKERGMMTIFTPDMPGAFNQRIGRDVSPVRLEAERRAMLDADVVTVNTAREKEAVVQLYGTTPEEQEELIRKIRVLPPGIETATFNPSNAEAKEAEARQALAIPEDAGFVAITAGRLSTAKNYESVIEGWSQYCGDNPQPGQYLVLITDIANKDEPYLRALQDRIDALPPAVRSSILLRDFQRDPLVIYAAADVFVTMSRLETYGSTLSEAMACGRPVIASDISEYQEQLGLQGGEPADADSLEVAKRLTVALDDDPKKMGQELAGRLTYVRGQLEDAAAKPALSKMMAQLGSRHSWPTQVRSLLEWAKQTQAAE